MAPITPFNRQRHERHMYRGRIAPTPSGPLHVGHARTFAQAYNLARNEIGILVMRIEDLDSSRCRPEFTNQAIDDLKWLGIQWQEGPDVGGPHSPYLQSQRIEWYTEVWIKLHTSGNIYPCDKSRQDVERALIAPHAEDDAEPIFPPTLRPDISAGKLATCPGHSNWRFRVPDGETISFIDSIHGAQSFTAGKDFGDFLIWRKDGMPAYELAVVADDHAMQINQVVRGADLLKSTARQILIYRALNWPIPNWTHVKLVNDSSGKRLSKRAAGLSIQELRHQGFTPEEILNTPIEKLISKKSF